jgi:hypothetical protein
MALHPKVAGTVVAGALTGLLVAELNRRGVTISPDEAADVTVLISFLAGYFIPENGTVVPPAEPVHPIGEAGFMPIKAPPGG